MPTHAELAGKLLIDAANFFRNLGEQNMALQKQMNENAGVFEQIARLMMKDPNAMLDGTSYAVLSGRLLNDAGTFFRVLAEQNEPLKEQMTENAFVYDKIAELVSTDPLGSLE